MDTIFIDGLLVRGILGVHPHERTDPQDIVISVTLRTDLRAAGASDALHDSVDYDELSRLLARHAEQAARQTIEALAEDLAAICLQDARVREVVVRVEKPQALPAARSVGVVLERRPAGME